jgi:hypothetical protein
MRRRLKSGEECPVCSLAKASVGAEIATLCSVHQLEVILVEHMQVRGCSALVSQLCTAHQPHIRGSLLKGGTQEGADVIAAGTHLPSAFMLWIISSLPDPGLLSEACLNKMGGISEGLG